MRATLTDVLQDLRFALRGLAKTPGFTIVAVLSLGIGLGVSTGLFTIFDQAVLRPMPGIGGIDRIVEVLTKTKDREMASWAYPDFEAVRDADTPLAELAGWTDREGSLDTADGAERVSMLYVSANYFRVLGVVSALGRDFLDSEDTAPGRRNVAILSHELWQERFEGDPDVVGRGISLNRTPYTVVGVAPAEFRGHYAAYRAVGLWVPMMQHPSIVGEQAFHQDPDVFWMRVLGRLEPGASVAEANAALRTVFARLAQDFPESHAERGARAVAFGPLPAYGRAAQVAGIAAAFAMVGLVLLIISGNVAGMVLARSATREHEIAVRLALGAGRGRLVRLLMVEALVVALAGGAVGVGLALVVLNRVAPAVLDIPMPPDSFRLDAATVGFALAVAVGTTLIFGLFPALRFSRPNLVSALNDAGGGGGRRVGRVHRIATTAQTGVALVLVVLCVLFVRTVGVMDRVDLGFVPENLLIARVDLTVAGYEEPQAAAVFLDRLRESVAALPGVATVAVADGVPADQVGNFSSVAPEDAENPAERITVEFTKVGDDFFRTIGASLVRGRGILRSDTQTSDLVIVVTRSLAERLWPGTDAVGRGLRLSTYPDGDKVHTVVGVVDDVAASRPYEDSAQVYIALRQHPTPRVLLAVRATEGAPTLVRSIQAAILDVDPGLPHPHVETVEHLVAIGSSGQRTGARMTAGLGLLALLLTAIGVYGVVAFAVANRTKEIGLRMAIGATREQVLLSVLRDALGLALPGLVVGALAAVGLAVALRSVLVGMSPVDPVSFAAAATVLLAIVLLASIVPARRASGVDPLDALRRE